MPGDAIKVVIVGGGCAGLATAWQLTKLNEAARNDPSQVTYDITVYEQSWRLGGKGASGRDEYGRILEHGLHVWLGFYENAFRMMRECYEVVEGRKWGPAAAPGQRLAHARFDDAFIPEPHLGVAVKRRNNELQVWSGFFPPMPGQPGDLLDVETNPFTLRGYASRSLGLARALLQSVLAPAAGTAAPGAPGPDSRSLFDEAVELNFDFDPLESPGVIVDHMTRMLRLGVLTSAAGLLQAVTILEDWIREKSPAVVRDSMVVKFVEAVATQTRRQLRDLVDIDEETRRKTEIIDLLMTIAVGLYRDRVIFSKDGLDAINGIDYREWLRKHGATNSAVDSAFVTGIYDLVFAYRGGDRERPALAAGQALRGALRMFFTYRGAMFWRLGSGMGDAVFAPLYRVLSERGVKFEFQHKLASVTFDGGPQGSGTQDARRVKELRFEAMSPRLENPLDHFGCWPDAPATKGTETRELVLQEAVNDSAPNTFDVVVFATGIDRFRKLCGTALEDLPRWRDMCDHTSTVGTVSAQVWLDRDLESLGWRRGSALVSAFAGRFNTWADMTRTLASERAHRQSAPSPPPESAARSVSYFCGVVPDGFKVDQRNKVLAELKALLATGLKPIWPAGYSEKGKATPLDALVAANGAAGAAANLADQYISINVGDSNQYTLSLPGSLAYRISPLDRSVANMTIAGDWTECGFNAGCVEAAVMSGMLAAHAISGLPDLNAIIGYHHP
jgi:uncharacterized protein with NAD-binding domain and iron-sulfur cluster